MGFLKNMNLPNKLTCLRMVLLVPFVICMLAGRAQGGWMWAALIIYVAASLTDMLDGKIARARHLITDFGKFMDPLAHKLLVCSTLICLVDLGRIPTWVVIIIIAREFIISGFRLVASDNGIVIQANYWGKCKTVSQMIMEIMLIIYFKSGPLFYLQEILIYVSCALTVISLVTYIAQNKQVLGSQK